MWAAHMTCTCVGSIYMIYGLVDSCDSTHITVAGIIVKFMYSINTKTKIPGFANSPWLCHHFTLVLPVARYIHQIDRNPIYALLIYIRTLQEFVISVIYTGSLLHLSTFVWHYVAKSLKLLSKIVIGSNLKNIDHNIIYKINLVTSPYYSYKIVLKIVQHSRYI